MNKEGRTSCLWILLITIFNPSRLKYYELFPNEAIHKVSVTKSAIVRRNKGNVLDQTNRTATEYTSPFTLGSASFCAYYIDSCTCIGLTITVYIRVNVIIWMLYSALDVLLTVHHGTLMNQHQLYTLFLVSWWRVNASTCFGRYSPIIRKLCTFAIWCNCVRRMCVDCVQNAVLLFGVIACVGCVLIACRLRSCYLV
jgi:hypothetical protein